MVRVRNRERIEWRGKKEMEGGGGGKERGWNREMKEWWEEGMERGKENTE